MQYYWSPTGSDAGTGLSPQDPWQTIPKLHTELAAGTFVPGDILSFEGGEDFEDESLVLDALIGTANLPITVTSYGSGTATIRMTTDGDDGVVFENGSSYIRFTGINIELPTGTSMTQNKACILVTDTCSNLLFRDVDTLGGWQSIRCEGSSAGRLERVNMRFGWYDGWSVAGSASWTFDDVEIYGVGYTATFSAVNANAAAGDGLEGNGTCTVTGADIRIILCKNPIHRFDTATIRLYRLFTSITRTDQQQAVVVDGSAGTPVKIRDSVFFFNVGKDTGDFYIEALSDDLELTNCTILSRAEIAPADLATKASVLIGAVGADIIMRNCVVVSYGALNAYANTGQTFTEEKNTWFNLGPFTATPFAAPDLNAVDPFLVSAATWIAAFGSTSVVADPVLANPTSGLGPEVAKVLATSSTIGNGSDLSATYVTEGRTATDYFGVERYAGLWSIGAHSYPVPSIQMFTEGSSRASMTTVPEIPSFASIQSVPPFPVFPAIDHHIESVIQFSYGMKSIGIWGLGGQKGSGGLPPIQPISTEIYQYTFRAGSAQAMDLNGGWRIGLTPGSNDPRGIFFELFTPSSPGTVIEARIRAEVSAAVTASQSIVFTAATSGLQTVNPAIQPGADIKLTLRFFFTGRQAGPNQRNDYLFTIQGFVADQLALEVQSVVIPQGYIEGYSIDYATGPAVYAGISGERSTFSGAASSASTMYWKTFYGSIDEPISPSSVPTLPAGEARPKTYMGSRRAIPNRLRNGGFTSFPKDIEVQRLVGAVEVTDPTYTPPADTVPLHVAILLNGTDSMTGNNTVRAISFLEQMVRNLPVDGSIMLCICVHRDTDHGTYGDIFPNVDVLLQNTILTPQTIGAAIAGATSFNAGGGQERWASGLDAVYQLMLQGEQSKIGYRRTVVIVDDLGSGDVGIRRTEAANEIDAIHSLDGLVSCDIFSVDGTTPDVVGRALGEGSWDILWPRPSVELPNQPLVNTTPSTTGYVSLVSVPNLISKALVARAYGFEATSATPPDLPIIQNPPLVPLTKYPNNAGTHLIYAEWCGYTWAHQLIRRRDNAVLTQPTPGEPPTVLRDAYQAWPDLDAGYAFDVPTSKPVESLLGEWFVFGVTGSVEVSPRDDTGDIIPSQDGGNLARIAFGQLGVISMEQIIPDVKPLRGESLTVAYSGRRFSGRVRVDVLVRVDGSETVIDTAFSQSFGMYNRRVVTTVVPLNAQDVEVVIRLSGHSGDAIGLSGFKVSLGHYAHDLPYSDSIEDSVIPSGAVVMVTGEVCPPGFRQVPDSEDRMALGVTGDPNFYAREFTSVESAGAVESFDSEIDLVFVIDTSSSQWTASGKQTILSWLQSMLIGGLPRDGRINVAIIAAASNVAAGAEVVLGLTPLTIESASSSVRAALDQLAVLVPGNDFAERAISTARQMLEAGTSRWRVLLRNTDGGGYNVNTTAVTTAEFAAILALPRFIESSAIIVNSTRTTVLAAGGEDHIFPVPSISAPGLLFSATGGAPGPALPKAFDGQPFQAGQYAAQILSERLTEQVQLGISLSTDGTGTGVISRIGGHARHDHGSGSSVGSSTDERDGFEEATADVAETSVPIPVRSRIQIKPYPFGVYPNLSRPEDPPALAVGPRHQHSVRTDMASLPPCFKLRFCEKL